MPFHKGTHPKTALLLMRSRYSAYALHLSTYICNTTHPSNPDFQTNLQAWEIQIDAFTHSTVFKKLHVIEFVDGEEEAFVTFKATFEESDITEKSRFLKVSGKWLYVSGVFLYGE